jgi:hypothetical protein
LTSLIGSIRAEILDRAIWRVCTRAVITDLSVVRTWRDIAVAATMKG